LAVMDYEEHLPTLGENNELDELGEKLDTAV
jgi:hypothetical protein